MSENQKGTIPLDATILTPAAAEMFAREVVPYLAARSQNLEAVDPMLIVLWLLEQVQTQRAEIAQLRALVERRPPTPPSIVRV